MAQSVGPVLVLMGIVTIGIAIGADFSRFEEPGIASTAKTAMRGIGPAALLLGAVMTFVGFRPKHDDGEE